MMQVGTRLSVETCCQRFRPKILKLHQRVAVAAASRVDQLDRTAPNTCCLLHLFLGSPGMFPLTSTMNAVVSRSKSSQDALQAPFAFYIARPNNLIDWIRNLPP